MAQKQREEELEKKSACICVNIETHTHGEIGKNKKKILSKCYYVDRTVADKRSSIWFWCFSVFFYFFHRLSLCFFFPLFSVAILYAHFVCDEFSLGTYRVQKDPWCLCDLVVNLTLFSLFLSLSLLLTLPALICTIYTHSYVYFSIDFFLYVYKTHSHTT